MADAPYNPLDRINLARSVELTLLQQPCLQLPIEQPFNGAGLYAIYYGGTFAPYKPISSSRCKIPIYVGRAQPTGSRTGLVDLSAEVGPVLWKRIDDHSKSIEWAKNLRIEDFRCRYLVVEDIFIAMGEGLLIRQFRPLWNVHISGFGLHDPGGRRHGGNRSEWDELHPGRPWHSKMRQVTTANDIRAKVREAFRSGETASLERLPKTAPPTAGGVPEAPETT